MMNSLRYITAALSLATACVCSQAVFGQAAPASTTAFYRGDIGHTGYSATSTPQILSVAWQNSLPDVKVAYSTPVLVDNVLYFGAGKHVYAINEKDGTIKWQYPADGTAASGEFNCSPAVADGKVFIGSEDKNLSVLDQSTGSLLWQVQTEGAVEAAPIVDNGTVFFGCSDSKLYAISEADQKAVWGGEFKSDGPIYSSPIIDNGTLYFADSNSNLYAIKENTGEKIWTYLPSGGVTPGGPVFKDNAFYVVSGPNVLSLSSRTGSVRSFFNIPANIIGPPTIGGNSIYVSASDQQIYSLNLRGNVLWHTRLQDIVNVPLVITDSYLYATSRRGVIYAIDPSTGKVVWSYSLQKSIEQPADPTKVTRDTLPQARTSTPVLVQDGKLFVVTNDGTVEALTGTAPDHVAPVTLAVKPDENSTVSGANIQFQAFVSDLGSGIDPSTVSLKVDGYTIPVYYDPTFSSVSVQFDKTNGSIGTGRVTIPTLPDGLRTATLRIADWRGNVETKTWSFTVDNSKNPADTAPPIALPGDNGSRSPGSGSGLAPLAIPGGGTTGTHSGNSSTGTSSTGNGASTFSGVNSGGNVPTYIPPPVVPSPPGAGGGGGGTGTGGGGGTGTGGGGTTGFPPPPPI